jgi:hypothetical protein
VLNSLSSRCGFIAASFDLSSAPQWQKKPDRPLLAAI